MLMPGTGGIGMSFAINLLNTPTKNFFRLKCSPPYLVNTCTLHTGIVLVYQQGLINTPYRYGTHYMYTISTQGNSA
jgi:hypothetical protein